MEFQVSPDITHLFADAVAAHIRSRADYLSVEQGEAWSQLWLIFRDANNATLAVPRESARGMYEVWSNAGAWRDESTRRYVKSHLRPQWRAQMRGHALAR